MRNEDSVGESESDGAVESLRARTSDLAPKGTYATTERCVELLRRAEELSGVDPTAVAAVLCDKQTAEQAFLGQSTIHLRGLVGPRLTLSARTFGLNLVLSDCDLEELDLTDARFIGVSLLDCKVRTLKAQRLACAGSLLILCKRNDCDYGDVLLDGATVGGNWEMGVARLDADADTRLRVDRLSADGIKVSGNAIFCGLVARGTLWLSGANISRDLDLRATCVTRGANATAFSLHSCRIGGRVLLGRAERHGDTRIEVPTDWRDLRVDGGIRARDAEFGGRFELDGARIVGSLDFNGSRFAKQVVAVNLRVEGDVSFDGVQLEHAPERTDLPIYRVAALDLSGSRVTGCGFFGDYEGRSFRASAPLRLRATQFGERLTLKNVQLSAGKPSGLSLVGSKIGTELHLAPTLPKDVEYDLRDVSCRLFALHGVPAFANLDGLQYSMLEVDPNPSELTRSRSKPSPQSLLALIHRFHGDPGRFAPGPYKALEAHLHATGADGTAREVARQRRKRELAAERNAARGIANKLRARASSIVLWCAGYGYSATTALVLSVAVIAGFVAVMQLWPDTLGQFCREAEASCRTGFTSTLAVAVDNFVPIVKLEIADQLHANSVVARWLLAALRLSGWLLTTLMVVAWSGLMRKS